MLRDFAFEPWLNRLAPYLAITPANHLILGTLAYTVVSAPLCQGSSVRITSTVGYRFSVFPCIVAFYKVNVVVN